MVLLSSDGCRHTEKTLAFISCLLLLVIHQTWADHNLLTNTCWRWGVYGQAVLPVMNLEVGCGTKGFILKRRSWSSRVTSCDRWVIYSSFDERVSVNGLCVGLISPHGSPRALQALQSFASKEDFYCVCREGMEKIKNGWKRGLGALMLSSTLPQLAPDFSCGSQLCFFFLAFTSYR